MFFLVSKARILFWCEVSFLCGVSCADLGLLWLGLLPVALFLFHFFRNKNVAFSFFLCVAFGCGIVRTFFAVPFTLRNLSPDGEQVTFEGTIADSVDQRINEQRATVTVTKVPAAVPALAQKNALVRLPLYPEVVQGDELSISCLLQPNLRSGDSYQKYLLLHNTVARCVQAHAQRIGHRERSQFSKKIDGVRAWINSRLSDLFPEPQGSLLAGILLGAKQGIPSSLLHSFQYAGLSHIVALSGFNISIIATTVFATLLWCGCSRKQSFWCVLGALGLFLALTGLSASVVRAAIMGVMVLVARYVGRRSAPLYTLLFSATAMTLWTPSVLLHDVGFQLSFLATAGLFWIAPWFEQYTQWMPETLGLREALSATLGATVATLPISIFWFGRVSLIGPIANLLVVPLVPLSMLLGFLALIVPFAGTLLAFLTWLVLTWMIVAAQFFGALPFATLHGEGLMIFSVVSGIVLLYFLARRYLHSIIKKHYA